MLSITIARLLRLLVSGRYVYKAPTHKCRDDFSNASVEDIGRKVDRTCARWDSEGFSMNRAARRGRLMLHHNTLRHPWPT
jgi:hypothetical protein